ncbi:WecB/TagA/CpsF family glycosyltransferase [Methylobacterium marchantiae]|uniref:WecB/TagA/CpsF family glycosyltransferase n=1 Tax=Methylobacterium marchantiae TaxID=600331 RepID=A0ABW3WV00_9HYPH|nr:N-acetylglucosaminyldiphosphoundecaprenol N-acetyl-beta-D-mannosaminyltransferase [Methylobacterium marchantiae]
MTTPSRARLRHTPTTTLGGLSIAALGMQETVDLMIEAVRLHPRPGTPLYLTSANGEVMSRHARDPDFARLMDASDLINADGQPMVAMSRYMGDRRLPERVATTDLYHGVARRAAADGLTFYLYGATEEENLAAVKTTQRLYPELRIAGHCHGYLAGDALLAKIAEIDALAPDILWIALGVPREQAFVRDYGPLLRNVAVIKTSGGLFNFLSGSRSRAPSWVQRIGFEWLWRMAQEPRRLFWRYFLTNPHSLYLILTRSGANWRDRNPKSGSPTPKTGPDGSDLVGRQVERA